MPLTITSYQPATFEEWNAHYQHCPYATFFHSSDWMKLWHAFNPQHQIDTRHIVFSDGKTLIVPLTFVKLYKGLIKKYSSSTAGTYGGWISKDELTAAHINLLMQWMQKTMEDIMVRVSPYAPLHGFDQFAIREEHTMAIDLSEGFEAVKKGFNRGNKSSINKAINHGVIVKRTNDLADWKAYFDVYQKSLKRWGDTTTSNYKWALFETIWEQQLDTTQLWVAQLDGAIIGGGLYVMSQHHVIYWHGASDHDHYDIRPINLLMHDVIQYSCEQGYQWFDFNPSGQHEGVDRFKRSFGAEAHMSYVWSQTNKRKNKLAKLVGRIKK